MTVEVAAAMFNTLKSDQSVALSVFGDSTGVGNTRWPYRLMAENIAAAFPNACLIKEDWDDTTQGYLGRTIIQAGALGQRHIVLANNHVARLLNTDIATRIATDGFEFDIQPSFDDWTPAATSRMAGQLGGAGQRGWYIEVATSGALKFIWSADGTALIQSNQSVVPGLVDGTAAWFRFRLAFATGNINIDMSTDQKATWTSLLAQAGAGATSIFNTNADFQIGGVSGTGFWSGKVYDSIIRDGINGPAITPISIEAMFDDTTPILSVGGSPTVYMQNASMLGAGIVAGNDLVNTAYGYLTWPGRFNKMLGFSPVHVIMCNTGQNDVAFRSSARMYTTWAAWISQIRTRSPLAAILAMNQNRRNPAVIPGGNASYDSYRQQSRAMLMLFQRLAVGGIDTQGAVDRAVASGQVTDATLSSDGKHEIDGLPVSLRVNEIWRVMSKGLTFA